MVASSVSRRDRRHGAASDATRRAIERLLREAREANSTGRAERAMACCRAALGRDPRNVDALCLLASLALLAGQRESTVDAARRALALSPDHVEASHYLGVALRQLGDLPGAIASLGRAIEGEPKRVETLVELSRAFLDAGDARGAEPFLNRALDIEPASPSAQTALARLYRSAGRLDDAAAACRRALAVDPGAWEAHAILGNLLREAGNQRAAIAAFEAATATLPERHEAWSSLLLTLQCAEHLPAEVVAERHRSWGRRVAATVRRLPPPPPTAALAGRRLRIGYLSSNFRRHAVAKFFEPVIDLHDRRRFEVCCYYNFPTADEVTDRIRKRADRFLSVCSVPDGHVAAKIRRDAIDILVDLDGHTVPNRLPVFFLKPAPIQVTWLGYLGTTGVPAIDYRLTDAKADPPGMADALHVEALWRLPATAWCYRPYQEARRPGPSPQLTNGFVTFASLNNPGKVTSAARELWARILRQTEESRLILHFDGEASRVTELRSFFGSRGIDPHRLLLVGRQSIDDYLGLYRRTDIALDTWPCAGGTTSCDALWMGVPVVSLAGTSSFSRTGASLLPSVGLEDLVTGDPEAYVATAIALASDRGRLARLRGELRHRMEASPLTDARAMAHQVEEAFLGMWSRLLARRDVVGG